MLSGFFSNDKWKIVQVIYHRKCIVFLIKIHILENYPPQKITNSYYSNLYYVDIYENTQFKMSSLILRSMNYS